MRITRKIRPAAAVSAQDDKDTISSASIVRLGTIADLVEGAEGNDLDGGGSDGYYFIND